MPIPDATPIPVSLDPPSEAARAVVRTLRAAGHEAWLVGGAVRDRLMGRPVGDWDVATDLHPEQVLELFDHAIPTGLQHGTVTVVVDREPIEVTTYRIETTYSDGRRPDGVDFTSDLREDLARRDFTVNAIAWDPDAGVICDPFDGRGDLARGLLRAVGDPRERFGEDGLRAMRAVRFACTLGLTIDPATRAAIPQTLDTFRQVAAERIRVELVKMLVGPAPDRGLADLESLGLLAVFWPSLVGRIDAAAVGRAPARLAPRLAVLLAGDRRDAGAHIDALRFSNAERKATLGILNHWDIEPAANRSDAAVWALAAEIGAPLLDDWLDAVGAAGRDVAVLRERLDALGVREGPLTPGELPVSGQDVMRTLGIPPSRRIGAVLRLLLERAWAEPALRDRAAMLEALSEMEPTG